MRWPWMRYAWLVGALLAAQIPVPGHAQMDRNDAIGLQNQIWQLRQELQSMRADMGRGYPGVSVGGGNDVAAQLLSRVQLMEEQVRQLRGRIDETQNLIARQNADLSKRIEDLTFQLGLQQGKGGTAPPPLASAPTPPPVREVAPRPDILRGPEAKGAPPSKLTLSGPMPTVISPPLSPPPQSFTFNQTPEPMRESNTPPPRIEPAKPVARPTDLASKPVTPPPANADEAAQTELAAAALPPPGGKRTPEMALQEGHAALARRDYTTAERDAREVMGNRTSPRAYDGQFLLAQTLASEKQFAQAAIAYDDAYNRSHKGRHAEDALVGLAGALTAINEKKAACDTLGRLRTEFPEVRADLRDTITKTNERAGCTTGH